MTDHHGFGFDEDHDPGPFDGPAYDDQHAFGWDVAHHVVDDPTEHAEPYPDEPADPHAAADPFTGHDADPLGADPEAPILPATHDDMSDLPDAPDPVEVFPPALDVGDLPEPVDGFPWIDTGSLGLVPGLPAAEILEPVQPQELAEYAATDLPPAVDPWAVLADSDDPATSALAKWWSEN